MSNKQEKSYFESIKDSASRNFEFLSEAAKEKSQWATATLYDAKANVKEKLGYDANNDRVTAEQYRVNGEALRFERERKEKLADFEKAKDALTSKAPSPYGTFAQSPDAFDLAKEQKTGPYQDRAMAKAEKNTGMVEKFAESTVANYYDAKAYVKETLGYDAYADRVEAEKHRIIGSTMEANHQIESEKLKTEAALKDNFPSAPKAEIKEQVTNLKVPDPTPAEIAALTTGDKRKTVL
jgi:hypothetical protein